MCYVATCRYTLLCRCSDATLFYVAMCTAKLTLLYDYVHIEFDSAIDSGIDIEVDTS